MFPPKLPAALIDLSKETPLKGISASTWLVKRSVVKYLYTAASD
jgi:hypothetical protein